MIRVILPAHLKNLAGVSGEVGLDIQGDVTPRAILDELEARHPVLRGTIRDHTSLRRRDFVRFFACQQDFSLEDPDTPLPESVASGDEPFRIVGSMAGG